MIRVFLYIAIICLLGCQQIPKPKVINTPLSTWLETKNSTVGIMSIQVEENIHVPDNFSTEVEKHLYSIIKQKGHSPVDIGLYREVKNSVFYDVGDLYDPFNGSKNTRLESRLYREAIDVYVQRFSPDLIISFHFYRTTAKYNQQIARWDNIVDTSGVPFLIFESGVMPAVSVLIRGYNPQKKKVFSHVQGVQTIFENNSPYDIKPEDIALHMNNLEKLMSALLI